MSFGLDFKEITGYNAFLAESWHEWFRSNPGALDMPCDIMDTGSVRQLVKHIFAVELRYTEQLNGRRAPEYDELPHETLDDLYSIRQRAVQSIAEFLKSTSDTALDEPFEVKTRAAGTLETSRRTVFIHSMMHATRHWAQLATLVREADIRPLVGRIICSTKWANSLAVPASSRVPGALVFEEWKHTECMELPERIEIRKEVMGRKANPQLTHNDLQACLQYAACE